MTLHIYSEPHNIGRCGHAMAALDKAMRWDEEVYGLEYDLDLYMIVAVDHFNMGAMENKGLNVFNTRYVLADPETATDADHANVETVIGHEYFHNWTGNRVTCRDWFQLSLKEGLTFSATSSSRRTWGRGRSNASATRASSATTSSRRTAAPTLIPCAPTSTKRSIISTPSRSTTRAPRSSA